MNPRAAEVVAKPADLSVLSEIIGAMRPSSLLLLAILTPVRAAQSPPVSFAECERLIAGEPSAAAGWRCLYRRGRADGLWDPAAAEFERHRSRHSSNPYFNFYAGLVERFRGSRTDKAFFEAAARVFREQRNDAWEVSSRLNLARALRREGALDESDSQLALAEKRALDVDVETVVLVRTRQADNLRSRGELDRAHALLREILFDEDRAEPLSNSVERSVMKALADICYELGRRREAISYRRQLVELGMAAEDRFATATYYYDLAAAQVDGHPDFGERDVILTHLRRGLDFARSSRNLSAQSGLLRLLGLMLEGVEALPYLEESVAVARRSFPSTYRLSSTLSALAGRISNEDPERARVLMKESLAVSLEVRGALSRVYAWSDRMKLAWKVLPDDEALEMSMQAIDFMESFRELQQGPAGRAGTFSIWVEAYHWLLGRILEDPQGQPSRSRLEIALSLSERMRARTLLEALSASRAVVPIRSDDPRVIAREKVLLEIEEKQLALTTADSTSEDRVEQVAELEVLEEREERLRQELNSDNPGYSEVSRTSHIKLSEMESVVGDDEALLAFQVAPWTDLFNEFAGGSWLFVTTREGTRTYRLPGAEKLASDSRILVGLVESRQRPEKWALAATSIYRSILAQPLSDLPPGIRRLSLIPDGPLHRLPFAALKEAPDSTHLIERFEIAQFPSATLWERWKRTGTHSAEIPLIAWADPRLPGGLSSRHGPTDRFISLSRGVVLGPLPFARREGRLAASYLGASEVLIGERATEASVRAKRLSRYGILHFAAHAVIDELNPARSAVMLARGPEDDGLLQPREIVNLELRGQTVVLSACQSANGRILRGEGVMSLARAFFQAGAHAIVGGLWRLRDDEAAEFFSRFYDGLGKGRSLARALSEAQRESIAAGTPAAAWAGITLLGNGETVPLPGGRRRSLGESIVILIPVLGLAILGGLMLTRRNGKARKS